MAGSGLNLFPVRVPIGRATGADGRAVDVLMTPEFARALSALLVRVGGANGLSTDEIAAMSASAPVPDAAIATLQGMVQQLLVELASATQAAARVHVLEQRVEELTKLVHLSGPAPVDWEHPGKIGAATPNSAKVTSFSATTAPYSTPAAGNTGSFNTNGTNAVSQQFGGDEATGYTWQRNIQQNVGAVPHRYYIYNTLVMSMTTGGIGVNGNVSATGQLVSTVATGTPPLSVLSTTMVPNLKSRYALEADGLTNPSPLPPAATDLPTVITLANALRTAAANKGL